MEMRATEIEHFYLAYIACLNAQDWSRLADFVEVDVRHNNRPLGVAGYRAMLQNDFATIPDLRYEVELLVGNTNCVGSRLDSTARREAISWACPSTARGSYFRRTCSTNFAMTRSLGSGPSSTSQQLKRKF